MNNLKEKLKKNLPTIGSWVTIGHPSIVEIMATAGFEWLTIDLEHSAIDISKASQRHGGSRTGKQKRRGRDQTGTRRRS